MKQFTCSGYGPVTPISHGTPYIVVEDGDYRGHRELYLKHQHDRKDLDCQYAEKTVIFTCDGGNVTKR